MMSSIFKKDKNRLHRNLHKLDHTQETDAQKETQSARIPKENLEES